MKVLRVCLTAGAGVGAALLTLSSVPAAAQNPSAVDQSDALRRRQEMNQLLRDLRSKKEFEAPIISPDEAIDVGPQSILVQRARHRWLELNLDSQLFWTDNLFFSESSPTPKVSSSALLNSAQIYLTPPHFSVLQGEVRPRIGFAHAWMNYAWFGPSTDPNTGLPKSDNDFDSQTLFGDLTWSRDAWQIQVGLDGQRLLSHQPTYGAYTEFYKALSPRWSVSRLVNLNDHHSLVFAYLGTHHFSQVDAIPGFADSDRNDRTEQTLLASYSWQFGSRWVFQPSYRIQLADYSFVDRRDLLSSFNSSLICSITSWLYVRAFMAYDMRESDDPITPDYRKFDAGLTFSANFKF